MQHHANEARQDVAELWNSVMVNHFDADTHRNVSFLPPSGGAAIIL